MSSAPGDGFRIFRIDNLNDVTRSTVTLSGLVLTGADTPLASFNGNGGAIYNKDTRDKWLSDELLERVFT